MKKTISATYYKEITAAYRNESPQYISSTKPCQIKYLLEGRFLFSRFILPATRATFKATESKLRSTLQYTLLQSAATVVYYTHTMV